MKKIDSVDWAKVIEVFRRCGSREIPAKNFRDLWNCFFPHEKLQCKDWARFGSDMRLTLLLMFSALSRTSRF